MLALPPATAFRRSINALIEAGQDLLVRLARGAAPPAFAGMPPPLPGRLLRDPARTERRVRRALVWVIALARALAGDRFYLVPPRPAPYRLKPLARLTKALRAEAGLPPAPPPTEAQRDRAQLRAIRRAFATQPVGVIARRLARRLDLRAGADRWPADLLTITLTPAEYAAAAPPEPEPQPQPGPGPVPAPQPEPKPRAVPPPPHHKRE